MMLAAAGVGILWLDWILSAVPDALDDSASDLADADDPRLVDVMRGATGGDVFAGEMDGNLAARCGNVSHSTSSVRTSERGGL